MRFVLSYSARNQRVVFGFENYDIAYYVSKATIIDDCDTITAESSDIPSSNCIGCRLCVVD